MGREFQEQASRGFIASVLLLKTQILFKEVQTILLERPWRTRDHVERGHVEENQNIPDVSAIPVKAPDII